MMIVFHIDQTLRSCTVAQLLRKALHIIIYVRCSRNRVRETTAFDVNSFPVAPTVVFPAQITYTPLFLMVSSSPHVFAFRSRHGYTVTNANITWRDYITLSLPSSQTSSQKDEGILPDRETACVTFRVTPPVVRSVVIVALLKFTKESSACR